MSHVVTVPELLDGHTVLDIECPDRIYLNGYVPTASAAEVFDGESVAFAATTNADVGPTPWFITIEDLSLPGPVEECGSGTTCSVTWTFDSPTTVVFQASVGDLPEPASLPGFILASSQTVSAEWLRLIICRVC
jgi:hypothetical protein